MTTSEPPILRPGETCWRLARADRVAFLIDAASYFAALVPTLRAARESVFIVGWDIHSRVRLGRRDGEEDGIELRALLSEITADGGPRVRVLSWDFAPIFLAEREMLPLVQLGWRTGPRVSVRLDGAHPVGGSQHQKIVVVDDRVAFVGGIDLTVHRWDTPEHAPADARRTAPSESPYPPFHDAQAMVEGDAAAALGELARARWATATGERPAAPARGGPSPWPEYVAPALVDATVGIARTLPAYERRPEVREIERLYVEAIARARRWIYVENQYLTSDVIAKALAERLASDDPPEICLVLPEHESGPLERLAMGTRRARVLAALREADHRGRLRAVTPKVGETSVYVHAKVMVVDDRLALVGSANLANRSMGFDSECNLAIEGIDEASRRTVSDFLERLLGEHLGAGPEDLHETLTSSGSLLATVDALGSDERGLDPLPPEEIDAPSDATEFLDPAAPVAESYVRRALPRASVEEARRSVGSRLPAIALAVFVAACFGVWIHLGTPDANALAEALRPMTDHPASPFAALGAFVVGSLVLVPVNALIIASVGLLGPWKGALVSLGGIQLSAGAGWLAGRAAWRDTVRRLTGDRLDALSRRLAERGVTGVAAVRLLPAAPFTVVSLVAGSSRVSLRDFLLGTLLGTLPGVLLLSFASDRLLAAVRDPSGWTLLVAGAALALLVGAVLFLRRVLRGS